MKIPTYHLYHRVRLVRCCELSGKTGTILGRSFTHPAMDSYIVLLDSNQFDGDGVEHAACSITEHCLEPINDLVIDAVEIYIEEHKQNYPSLQKPVYDDT